MTTIQHVTRFLETLAPLAYQESYDNAGLLVGDPAAEVTGILTSLDCTEAVVLEAVAQGCNLVVAHHPIVFKGLKKLNGSSYVERTVMTAIRQGVALYASHTNLDSVVGGVNYQLAERLGLHEVRILAPKRHLLEKLTVFVPHTHTATVLDALHGAGAGQIGAYDRCSFRSEGTGAFRPLPGANPAIGTLGQVQEVGEDRLEVLFPAQAAGSVLAAMRAAHPYETPAFFRHALENEHPDVGAGAIGTLPEALPEADFLRFLKTALDLPLVRHTPLRGRVVQRVAVCGGAGSFLLGEARRQGADAFVTADFKYHEFFDAEGQVVVCDVGHYESEVATKALLRDELAKKFTTFAVKMSETPTNPVHYFF